MAGSERFSRTERLLGQEGMEKLAASTVAVFGIGGVGSFVAEGLARAGVGHLVLIDNDVICLSNINRQIHATADTVGRRKTEAMRERILGINPEAVVDRIDDFYLPENGEKFFRQDYDYVADAIDTITGKIHLVLQYHERSIPIICSMGAGNKLEPARFEVADIYDTSVDPIARIMRKKLKEHRIPHLKVVYSKEKPIAAGSGDPAGTRAVPGSISFVPSVAGLIMAGEIVRDLIA
ncbi:MAG: tRNA threonylcarbamoyladenosine dehydratase [Selenomonadaceae bacterium]|nr:tRNA threonylcarbamoyladenosine dehydratase [Selenomonadaceae bacterium]